MSNIRRNIETGMERLGEVIVNYRWFIIILTILITVFMVSRLPNLTFDMSTEGFLHKDDPQILQYDSFKEQFGKDELIIVMISPKDVFNAGFLKKLKAFHEELEETLPSIKDVRSLINARKTIGNEGELLVEDLLEEMPEDETELAELKEFVLSHPLYRNLLVSEDGSFTTLIIEPDVFSAGGNDESGFEADESTESNNPADTKKALTNEENAELVRALEKIMEKYNGDDFPLMMSGTPVVTDYLKKVMQTDIKRFTGLAILTISIFLFLIFRRFSGVFIPLIVVILSVVYTFALISIFGVSIKIPTVILPSFLLAIGIGASVHLVAMFYHEYEGDNKVAAISYALGHSGLPIVMTSLTTSVSLASFSTAKIAPIADLGIFAASGVVMSLVLTLFLLPALLAVVPIKAVEKRQSNGEKSRIDRFLLRSCDMAVDHPYRVLISSALIIGFLAFGLIQLDFSHDVIGWYKKDSVVRQSAERVDDKMKGSVSVEIVIDTGKENGLYNPETMNKLDEFSSRIAGYDGGKSGVYVGKTISLADMLKEIHKALNENKTDHYVIPDNQPLIAQEFLLFENSGSDDLEDVVDSRFSKARLTAKVPWNDSVAYVSFVDFIKTNASELFGDSVDITLTGMVILLMTTVYAMMHSMATSYTIAFVLITLLMILLIGDIRMGIVSMVPNIFPIIVTLGLMGWIGINLDLFTLLIGSIAIGLAVDDTIHFLHNFKRYHQEIGNVKEAVEQTMMTAGRAMLVTSIVLTTGFWLFMFASMNNLFAFGLLTGFTLICAFLADILIVPAILSLLTWKGSRSIVKINGNVKKTHMN